MDKDDADICNENGAPSTLAAPPKEKRSSKRVWNLWGKKNARKIFGAPLTELECYENTKIPIIAFQSIEFLKSHGLKSEGLFRIPGSQKQINEMKAEYDATGGRQGVHQGSDVHAVSGLLKQFLRDLPEPLLTYDLYPHLVKAQSQREIITRLCSIREQISHLPEINREMLKYLLEFLTMVCRNSEDNKMTTSNLAIIFGPNLLQPKDGDPIKLIEEAHHVNGIVKTMIDEFEFIINGAEVPRCVLDEEQEWTKRGSRGKKVARAMSDPGRSATGLIQNGLKTLDGSEERMLLADAEGVPRVSLPVSVTHHTSIRRKLAISENGSTQDDTEQEHMESGDGDESMEIQHSESTVRHEQSAHSADEKSIRPEKGGNESASSAEDCPDEDRIHISPKSDNQNSPTQHRSWSVNDTENSKSLLSSPQRRSRTSNDPDTQMKGPTTASVARMKVLIAKANAEREQEILKQSTPLSREESIPAGRTEESKIDGADASDALTESVEYMNNYYADLSVDCEQDARIADTDDGNLTPKSDSGSQGSGVYGSSTKGGAEAPNSDSRPGSRPQSNNGSPEGSLIGGEPGSERVKRGSRLFGLKSRTEKEKNERRERKKEKREERDRERQRERDQTIALLYDRLRLWREKEKIPENVQLMNMKQIKAEKHWLKKELRALDSKGTREELRPLHLRYQELAFYLENLRRTRAMGSFPVSSSVAIQSYSALLKESSGSVKPPRSSDSADLSPHSGDDSQADDRSGVSSGVPRPVGHSRSSAREGDHEGHHELKDHTDKKTQPRSNSFIFRREDRFGISKSSKRSKERDGDSDPCSSRTSKGSWTSKKKSGSYSASVAKGRNQELLDHPRSQNMSQELNT